MSVPPPKPPDEEARLEALRQYRVLDTEPEECFDDFTSLASMICEVPISLISLIDRERQWFKSKVGLDASETDRDLAFCAHAILDPGQILEVPDAIADQRFCDNPLVTGAPGIRFYAGAPLRNREGFSLGTLCVIDREKRELDDHQRKALEILSRRVVAQLELGRISHSLAEALDNVSILEGLLPICCHCKKIRDDDGYWARVEDYLSRFTKTRFTHGICPCCASKHFPEFA